MDLAAVRADMALVVSRVNQTILALAVIHDEIHDVTDLLRTISGAVDRGQLGEAARLWTDAQQHVRDAANRLSEGKGHANAYLRSL